jgi:hypothetical protein
MAAAGEGPLAVSPGSQTAASAAAVSCPTFSWSAADDAMAYELVVYRVKDNGELEAVLEAHAPRGATSWTPSARECPGAGQQFAWAIRSSGGARVGAWSEVLHFETPGRPTDDEVRDALQVLRRFQQASATEKAAGSAHAASQSAPRQAGKGSVAAGPGSRPPGSGRKRPRGIEDRPGPLAHRLAAADSGAARPLHSPSVGIAPGPSSLTGPDNLEFDIAGDFDLGGFIFRDGVPFIHNDKDPSNTAVGLNAMVSLPVSGSAYLTAVGYQALRNQLGTTSNTAIGANALYSNTSGQINTAIGAFALYSNVGGSNNTGTGVGALYLNSTGVGNTATGAYALATNSSAHFNTATGQFALTANSGTGNSAHGNRSLRYNSSGTYNTAAGLNALYANTTGSHNTATGARALQGSVGSSTGSRNTANGSWALYYNSSGINNTAVGSGAMFYNTTGNNNTAVGESALSNNIGGYSNTALGALTMGYNVSGGRNTAVGHQALYGTTGSANTALGYRAGAYQTSGSFNISIGRGSQGIAAESGVIRIGGSNYQSKTFIEGIRGASGTFDQDVCVNSSNQLGPCSVDLSSRRFKEGIREMGEASSGVSALRPVVFRYKPEAVATEPGQAQFGLIAEEVAEIFPTLVTYDDEGRAFTVRYELLTPLLLNEAQKQKEELAVLRKQMLDRDRHVAELRRQLEEVGKKRGLR